MVLGGAVEDLGGNGEILGGGGEILGGDGEDLGGDGEILGGAAQIKISVLGRRCECKNRLYPYRARECSGAEGGSLPPLIGL